MTDEENKTKVEVDDSLDDSVVAEEAVAETIKKLREKLKECQKARDEYLAGWQRARADYANQKRDLETIHKDAMQIANGRLFDDLIPALDSFDMAFGNRETWEKVDKNWRSGVEFIYGQIVKGLEGHHLSQFTPLSGEKFDSLKHEPVGSVPTDDEKADHTVAEVVKKGYLVNDKVFRPAHVKIFEFKNP